MAERRKLHARELVLAYKVFKDKLPYFDIRIGDDFGLQGRAWMEHYETGPMDTYVIHVGPEAYQDVASEIPTYVGYARMAKETFIHELTHVWQAHKQGKSVLLRSILVQGACIVTNFRFGTDLDAYSYEPGLPWDVYTVEQQANIVENWTWRDKMSTDSELYPYIRDHIWTS